MSVMHETQYKYRGFFLFYLTADYWEQKIGLEKLNPVLRVTVT